jgi:hypothetical protein
LRNTLRLQENPKVQSQVQDMSTKIDEAKRYLGNHWLLAEPVCRREVQP